jgi:hypothetical protein
VTRFAARGLPDVAAAAAGIGGAVATGRKVLSFIDRGLTSEQLKGH